MQRAVSMKELRRAREVGSQPARVKGTGSDLGSNTDSVTCCYGALGKLLGCLQPWFPHLFLHLSHREEKSIHKGCRAPAENRCFINESCFSGKTRMDSFKKVSSATMLPDSQQR